MSLFKKIFGREKSSDPVKEEEKDYKALAAKYVGVFGGKENIISIDHCTTRLRLTIRDFSIVDERGLKKLGGKGFSKIGPKNLQVTVGNDVGILADEMKNQRKTF